MKAKKPRGRGLSRRDIIKTASAVGIAASAGPFFNATPARAAKTLKILQWMSEPRRPWIIDTEVSGLEQEVLGTGDDGGQEVISFQRYDVALEPAWIERETGIKVTEADMVRIDDFVNPRIMQAAYDIATKVAAAHVDATDFPAAFDVRP